MSDAKLNENILHPLLTKIWTDKKFSMNGMRDTLQSLKKGMISATAITTEESLSLLISGKVFNQITL